MKRLLSVALVLLWTSTAHANPEITVDLPGGATMEFVWIEPGTFAMGSPPAEIRQLNSTYSTTGYSYSHEGPQHEVTLQQGYWLGKYEVTQGQWQGVMGTTPWSGQSYVQSSARNPAVHISWDDVQGLVHALNQSVGDSLYRLPTEAEWEYACRAETTTRWSFGDSEGDLGRYAWYNGNAWNVGLTWAQPVGTKLANPWGLYDLHGNVWEWVQDWYGGYGSAAVTDPLGPSTGSDRVIRGGHFSYYARDTRSANRLGNSPDYRYSVIGVRLVRMGSGATPVTPGTWGQIKMSAIE